MEIPARRTPNYESATESWNSSVCRSAAEGLVRLKKNHLTQRPANKQYLPKIEQTTSVWNP